MFLGDPSLRDLQLGARVDLVLHVHGQDNSAVALWTGDVYFVKPALPQGIWTLYQALLADRTDGSGCLLCDHHTTRLQKPELQPNAFSTIKEVCAGIGGISLGAGQAKCRTLVFLDRSEIACETIRMNGGRAMCGDVADRSICQQVHEVESTVGCVITAGFPCQPYSRQGNGNGLQDNRGLTLMHILQLAWHHQAAGLVLECVPEVQDYADTMALLHQFASAACFQMHSVVLDLGDVWGSHRRRWWCIMLPSHLPAFSISPWPPLSVAPTVADVIPEWPLWPRQQELELEWTVQEQSLYADPRFGKDPRRFVLNGKAPTALHSWGNALTACPCKCRKAGFSLSRLETGGLRGLGVVSAATGKVRFPHAQEVGLLNSMPPSFVHLAGARAALCLVGQLAAPAQAAWVFLHVATWTEQAFDLPSSTVPIDVLSDFLHGLLKQREMTWLLPSMWNKRVIQLSLEDTTSQVVLAAPTTVRALLQAEANLAGFGCTAAACHPLPFETFCSASTEPLQIRLHTKRQAKRLPSQSITLFVLTAHCVEKVRVQIGAFLFEALAELGLGSRQPCHRLPSYEPMPFDSRLLCDQVVDARPLLDVQSPLPGISDIQLWRVLLEFSALFTAAEMLLLSPAMATVLLRSGGSGISPELLCTRGQVMPPDRVLVVFESEAHWATLYLERESCGEFAALYLDGVQDRLAPQAESLAHAVGVLFQTPVSVIQQQNWCSSFRLGSCGLAALAHARAVLEGSFRVCQQDLREVERAATHHFCPIARCLAFGGLSQDQHAALCKLLQDHGVPADHVQDRVAAAVKKIGAGPLGQALNAKVPWPALKSVASAPSVNFKYVLPAELEAHIARKSEQKFGTVVHDAKHKKQKGKKSVEKPPLSVDPLQLQLAPGSFTTAGSEPLCQLAFNEVTSQANGVAFCTAAQMQPFLQDSRSISVAGLALVSTTVLPPSADTARTETVRFPAIYLPTGEAVLLSGTILQLGDEPVVLEPGNIDEIETVSTQTCRLTVFKDELQGPWQEFAVAPIRFLLAHVAELTLCKDQHCKQDGSCPRFHAAVDEPVDSLLLDVWSRQFLRAEGGKTNALQACVFQALVRVPSSALQHLAKLVVDGLYVEPRAADGFGV